MHRSNSECGILTMPAPGFSRGHRSLPRAQVTIIFLFHFPFGHLTQVIYHCFYNRIHFPNCLICIHTQSILQCLAIHSMSAAGNNKCDLHTYTDIIIAGRSVLILGKGYFTPVTPKKDREASAQSSAFHSNWNQISITPLGFATPDLKSTNTNLGQPHKANPIRNNSRVVPQCRANWPHTLRLLTTTRPLSLLYKLQHQRVYDNGAQYANEFTVSRFRAVSGPTKRSSYVKGSWWVE